MTSVLLIEPDKLLAMTYIKALKSENITLHWESSAQNSVSYIDKHPPTLIILELQLASHNGVEFLHELRSHSDWQKIPVILHTVVPMAEINLSDDAAKQLGIVEYLYKPQTSLAQLIAKVGKHLFEDN